MKQQGLILVTTLLLLALLALFTLAQLQFILLDYQALNAVREKQQALWELESLTGQLVNTVDLTTPGPCLLKSQDLNKPLDLLVKQQGCRLDKGKKRFYYLFEDLGIFPCLQLRLKQRLQSTQHFSLSIRAAKQTPLLQVRFARPIALQTCEAGKVNQGHIGLLTWRSFSPGYSSRESDE
jgi:hypothetical protein